MPALTRYLPGIAAVEQCTYIIHGGSPVALTPANEIILPALTLPISSKTVPSTPTKTSSSLRQSSAQPASSPAIVVPTRIVTSATPVTPPTRDDDVGTFVRPSTQSGPLPTLEPERPGSGFEEQGEATPTTSSEQTPDDPIETTSSSSSDRSSQLPVSPSVPASRSAPTNADTATSPNDRPDSLNAGGMRPATVPSQNFATTNRPADALASFIVLGISGASLDEDVDDAAYVLDDSTTLGASQEAIVVEGTTYTALPSGSGVLAAANGQSETVTTFALVGNHVASIDTHRVADIYTVDESSIATDPALKSTAVQNNQATYIVGGIATISRGGDAMIVSGKTYSVPISGSGIIAHASGQTTTLNATPFTSNPIPFDAYIVQNSATITAGGSAAIISGTTYSALPSSSGFVIFAHGESKIIDRIALDGIGTSSRASDTHQGYIVEGSVTVFAGGPETAISGTTYSALPSGAGVIILADGNSRTSTAAAIAPDRTAQSMAPARTDQSDSVVPFAGSACDGKVLSSSALWFEVIITIVAALHVLL